jgi:hypothetical protein
VRIRRSKKRAQFVEPWLTLHRRDGQAWPIVEARQGESVRLESMAAAIAVDDVYRDGLEDAD